jgi:phenylacetate-CoA ligase
MRQGAYFDDADPKRLIADYPLGADFLRLARDLSRDALRARQDARFRSLMAFAWKVPFYQRLWNARGIEPGDIRSLEDIGKLPTYSKADLMESVEAFPPIGDFHGQEAHPRERRPAIIFQTTSGTTGKPQPLLFGPKSREVQNLLLARLYQLQGMTSEDVVHSVYGHGMVNGGHYVREAVLHFVGARFMSAGTGVETRSQQQVQLMRDFGATTIVGFGDYIRRLAEIAREMGIEPGRDIPIRMISGHLGAESHEAMSAVWGGAKVYDWYGVGDTGAIAGEGPDRSGLYIQEDAQFLELLDVDTHEPVADGAIGDMVCTCLFKDDIFPIIRFNTHDVSKVVLGASPLGLCFRRIEGFLGRSDNMVKLRGVNVYPTGVGAVVTQRFSALGGEFLCRVERIAGRDEMTVLLESTSPEDADLSARCAAQLRATLGVEMAVELHPIGALALLTGIEQRQKPIRLIDKRKAGA